MGRITQKGENAPPREEMLEQGAGKGGADWLRMLVGLRVLEEGEQTCLPSPTSPPPPPLPQTEKP